MATAAGAKSGGWGDASMTLAARAKRGARGAWRWVVLPRREVLAVDEGKLVASVEGRRTASVLIGAGSAIPRCCIAERKCSSGLSIWSAFAQAARHL